MIACPKCGKENQDHYKFCLGCGGELPRDAAAQQPKSFATPIPGSATAPAAAASIAAAVAARQAPEAAAPAARAPSQPAQPAQPARDTQGAPPAEAPAPAPPQPAAPAPAPSAAGGAVVCPECKSQVPPGFKFCGTCGAKVTAAPPSQPAVAAAAVPQPAAATGGARLILIRPDGSEGGAFSLGTGATVVGRDAGAIFGGDSYLSPKHATFTYQGGQVIVKDESSLNGVYVRIVRDQKVELGDGDVFRIGQEIIRFDSVPKPEASKDKTEPLGSPVEGLWGRISLVTGRESTGNAFPVGGEAVVLGRERGDILFPEDGYVSGIHCRLHKEGAKVFLTDLGSSNGTYLRLKDQREIGEGDFLLMGQQLFRLSL